MTEEERMIWATAQMKLRRRMDGASILTSEEIEEVVDESIRFYGSAAVDREAIVRDLEASFQTRIGAVRDLSESDENWRPWLPARKGQIEWQFWNRYESYLLQHQRWAATTLRRLDET